MVYRLPPLNALRAFEAAANHLSFKKAAEALSVTPTAVSHQIKGLENYLGVVLFHRLTRALELTPEGEAMLPKVREGMACFAAAVESTRASNRRERLVVSAPPSFAARWLVPRLRRFSLLQPQVELHLVSSLLAIDSDEPWADPALGGLDLRDGESQVWIRFGMGQYPNLRVDKLFESDYIAVCSPKLLGNSLALRHPEEVRLYGLIHDDTIASEKARPSWHEWLRVAGVSGVDANLGPHFSDSGLALAAAVDGQGIALASRSLVGAEIAEGRLVSPFDVSVEQRYAYFLALPEAMAERPAVAAFRAWLLHEAHEHETAA